MLRLCEQFFLLMMLTSQTYPYYKGRGSMACINILEVDATLHPAREEGR